MKQGSKPQSELFWPRVVMRKLLNITPRDSDYSADTDDEDDTGSDSETEEFFECGSGRGSRFRGNREEELQPDLNDGLPRLRRRKSETFRAQYINTKEIRICAGTWNVGGKVPPDELDIDDWIDINEPADIYVLGRIIWLGDLNYRINLSYNKAHDLISKKDWSKLIERDQLVRELRKGHTFDGWSEGALNFAPTYKYELNSEKYYGEDPKVGRRTPAWCDRILSYGKGMRQLSYRRTELKLSDHRPVTAIYMAEVEVFCPRKLQRALTYTDAEIENKEVAAEAIEY